jgi:hypothetical protein
MPYHIGEKGSYGCSGYPVVKDGTGEVMGCHDSAAAAQAQISAINISEAEKGKKKMTSAMGQPYPADNRESFFNWSTPVRKPQRSTFSVGKYDGPADAMIKEGDFVMGMTSEGVAFGRVEHIMWEGGTLGEPGEEYSIESMPPENPAMSVRLFEVDDNEMEPTAYSIGMMYQDAQVVDVSNMTMEQENELESMPEGGNPNMEYMAKAETYSPNDGMKAAARRAIAWKEEGKAKGAGTPVGWGRARDIVAGRSMSLSVVKRMYSFFSRHEVDKKATGFRSGEEGYPSKGRVMWDAWGGDAGYSWSRGIAERNKNKSDSLFDFGTVSDLKAAKQARTEAWFAMRSDVSEIDLVEKADSVRVGQMVSWNSSGGTARGKVRRIIRSGSYNVPGTDITINGTEEDPAVVITLYRDGDATDTTVAHRMSTLRAS